MRILAVLMTLIGLMIGLGGALELRDYDPERLAFWVGVIATPAGLFFALVGLLLWFRGAAIRRLVLLAGIVMACATIVGTAFQVMGLPATIIGMVGALAAVGWFWRTGAVTV
jgi:hypothetical protein